jgi:predicted transcriptional regulator
MPLYIRDLNHADAAVIFKALASESRIRILELLADGELNINELSSALGLAQPSVTKHIQVLQEAGLIVSDYTSGAQGMQKRCRRVHDRIVVELAGTEKDKDYVVSVEVPVGMYTQVSAQPTCGLASRDRMIGVIDDPLAFTFPDRAKAEILWSGGGSVEYMFPNSLPFTTVIDSVELAMEISSEAPGYANDFPSDITIWINDVEIGTWMSPGDPGGERGRLNPAWWQDYMNQHGYYKVFSVGAEGAFVDGQKLSDVSIEAINVRPWQATKVRIGVKDDAKNQGGFSLFGRGFGSHETDVVFRIHHSYRGGNMQPAKKTFPFTD